MYAVACCKLTYEKLSLLNCNECALPYKRISEIYQIKWVFILKESIRIRINLLP